MKKGELAGRARRSARAARFFIFNFSFASAFGLRISLGFRISSFGLRAHGSLSLLILILILIPIFVSVFRFAICTKPWVAHSPVQKPSRGSARPSFGIKPDQTGSNHENKRIGQS